MNCFPRKRVREIHERNRLVFALIGGDFKPITRQITWKRESCEITRSILSLRCLKTDFLFRTFWSWTDHCKDYEWLCSAHMIVWNIKEMFENHLTYFTKQSKSPLVEAHFLFNFAHSEIEKADIALTLSISYILGPFIRGKIRRVLRKTRTFRINGTFRLK